MRGALLALVACGQPTTKPVVQQPQPLAVVPADAPAASQEERLAAIQKAMNVLDEAAQQCWAKAATKRFDIEGKLVAQIEIVQGARSVVSIVSETVHNPELVACMTEVLVMWPWAKPLAGQTIQLPFQFRHPDGQNVIDRDLVSWVGQGKVNVRVLLDETNTGNAAASMVEVAIAPGAATGLRYADRNELWFFFDDATVGTRAVSKGTMMFVPKDGARDVMASKGAVRAVVVIVPGGREGSARAGALPAREVTNIKAATVGPTFLPGDAADRHLLPAGSVLMYAQPATIQSSALSAEVLQLDAGGVPEHVHATETELLFVLGGSGTMTVGGVALQVTPTSVVQIPANTKHSFTVTTPVQALQIYTPAGPEQRFKKP